MFISVVLIFVFSGQLYFGQQTPLLVNSYGIEAANTKQDSESSLPDSNNVLLKNNIINILRRKTRNGINDDSQTSHSTLDPLNVEKNLNTKWDNDTNALFKEIYDDIDKRLRELNTIKSLVRDIENHRNRISILEKNINEIIAFTSPVPENTDFLTVDVPNTISDITYSSDNIQESSNKNFVESTVSPTEIHTLSFDETESLVVIPKSNNPDFTIFHYNQGDKVEKNEGTDAYGLIDKKTYLTTTKNQMKQETTVKKINFSTRPLNQYREFTDVLDSKVRTEVYKHLSPSFVTTEENKISDTSFFSDNNGLSLPNSKFQFYSRKYGSKISSSETINVIHSTESNEINSSSNLRDTSTAIDDYISSSETINVIHSTESNEINSSSNLRDTESAVENEIRSSETINVIHSTESSEINSSSNLRDTATAIVDEIIPFTSSVPSNVLEFLKTSNPIQIDSSTTLLSRVHTGKVIIGSSKAVIPAPYPEFLKIFGNKSLVKESNDKTQEMVTRNVNENNFSFDSNDENAREFTKYVNLDQKNDLSTPPSFYLNAEEREDLYVKNNKAQNNVNISLPTSADVITRNMEQLAVQNISFDVLNLEKKGDIDFFSTTTTDALNETDMRNISSTSNPVIYNYIANKDKGGSSQVANNRSTTSMVDYRRKESNGMYHKEDNEIYQVLNMSASNFLRSVEMMRNGSKVVTNKTNIIGLIEELNPEEFDLYTKVMKLIKFSLLKAIYEEHQSALNISGGDVNAGERFNPKGSRFESYTTPSFTGVKDNSSETGQKK